MRFIKYQFLALLLQGIISPVWSQIDTIQHISPGRVNSEEQQTKPYVILISVDGLRHDFPELHNASNLLKLSSRGVRAEYMLSSYPSLTFPNHYSIITGLYPAHHGLVDNSFNDTHHPVTYNMHNDKIVVDSSWYGGTPLWVVAERQHMLTASFYWVASDAAIQGVRPTYYYRFNELIPMETRLRKVRDWLSLPADRRPHFISFYFPEVDHQAHNFGPDSKEAAQAMKIVDTSIGRLAAMADSLRLPVNFIVVSDHGMTSIDVQHPLVLPMSLRDTAVATLVGGSTMVHVYVKDPKRVKELYVKSKQEAIDIDVFWPSDVPGSWHYGTADDRYHRIGDFILCAKYPRIFVLGGGKTTPGKHGFDPSMKDMHATFIAWGPQIKKAGRIPPFENVNVYPLIAQILGLSVTEAIDGSLSNVSSLLR